jgi:DNA-binding NtrC family response regulator
LLLDEIAELSLPIQAKLLRAIEQHEVVPLGESTPVPIEIRILAAAQSPLRQAVEERRFRGDLLARLEGLTVRLPPLRERIEEVPYLFAKLIEQHRGAAGPARLDPLLVEHLCAHDWPFNVRELVLLVRRLLALHPGAAVLDHAMLAAELRPRDGRQDGVPDGPDVPTVTNEPANPDQSREETRDPDPSALLSALRAAHGNVRRAAVALGISRGRLYRLMEKMSSLDLAAIRQNQ